MNEQPKSPNSAGAGEIPTGAMPDRMPAGPEQSNRHETAPAMEAGPTIGASPAPSAQAQPAASQPTAKLSRDDVSAVIAAVPGPNGPSGAVPTPTMASDVDVIEPEWVDKAEEVVRAHQGDPYGEEEAIEDLQQDYLQKRYGYKVSDPNGDNSKPEKA